MEAIRLVIRFIKYISEMDRKEEAQYRSDYETE
jgi:hypothetical protein